MNLKTIISLIVVCFFMFSCEKTEFPENEVLDPIFKINGEIDGQDIEFTPGMNGYYLFTDIEETYEGNYELYASIENTNCEDCEPSIGIVWTSNTGEFHSEEFDVDDDFLIGDYDFGESSGDQENFIDLSNIIEIENIDFLWVNGNPVLDEIIELDISMGTQFLELEYGYNVPFFCDHSYSLTSLTDDFCELYTETIVPFSYTIDDFGLATIYPPDNIEADTELFWMIDTNGNAFDFLTMGNETFTFQFPFEDLFAFVSLDYEFSDLFISESQSMVAFGGPVCDYSSFDLFSVLEEDEPEVMLVYNDGDGNEYFSNPFCLEDAEQGENSFFEILAIEEFQENENGDPTKKVEFQTTCQLFKEGNFGGESIQISNLHGTIAFAYPE